MDEWLLYSLASCLLYSIWTIFSKLASATIDSTTSNLIQLPIRTVVTLLTALQRTKRGETAASGPGFSLTISAIMAHIGDLSLFGSLYTTIACISSVSATFLLGDALEKGGDASSIAVITGSYPAAAYIISMVFGLEEVNSMKLIGVALAIGSCYCFANA